MADETRWCQWGISFATAPSTSRQRKLSWQGELTRAQGNEAASPSGPDARSCPRSALASPADRCRPSTACRRPPAGAAPAVPSPRLCGPHRNLRPTTGRRRARSAAWPLQVPFSACASDSISSMTSWQSIAPELSAIGVRTGRFPFMPAKGNSDVPTIRPGNWNAEWAPPASTRDQGFRERITGAGCEILCLVEASAGPIPAGGHVLDAGNDWGHPVKRGRSRVLLWSRQPWTSQVGGFGSQELAAGRLVADTSETLSAGLVTVAGACLPWRGAQARTGREDRAHAGHCEAFE